MRGYLPDAILLVFLLTRSLRGLEFRYRVGDYIPVCEVVCDGLEALLVYIRRAIAYESSWYWV